MSSPGTGAAVEPLRASTLRSMPVVSIAGGVKLGDVADVVLEAAAMRVFGLVLVADDRSAVVPFEKVLSVGPDAITVERFEAAAPPEERDDGRGARRLNDLIGQPAVNTAGWLLGDLADLLIDRRDGRLTGAVVRKGGVLGMGASTLTVPSARIRSLGPRFVTVERLAETEPADPAG